MTDCHCISLSPRTALLLARWIWPRVFRQTSAMPAWWPICADGTVVPESSEDLRHFAQVSAYRASIKDEPVVGRVIVGKLHRDRTDLVRHRRTR